MAMLNVDAHVALLPGSILSQIDITQIQLMAFR